jgi:molybdopterin converting factor small subunit
MVLQVKLFATLRQFASGYDPHQGLALDVLPGTTVAQVIRELGLPPEDVTLILVDGVHRQPDYALQGHERVAFFPPIGGG